MSTYIAISHVAIYIHMYKIMSTYIAISHVAIYIHTYVIL